MGEHARSLLLRLGVMLAYWPLTQLRKRWDYTEVGGAPLLGVNGVSIIGHGKSTPKAIKNMILKAEEMVRKKINTHIHEALAATR